MDSLSCKKCGSGEHVKAGFVRSKQRYKCKVCGCQFTDTARRGVHPALKGLAVALYGMCGVAMEKIGKLFGVSGVAVLKWVRAAGLQVQDLPDTHNSEIVMIDEMWHFVDGKKTRFGSGVPLTGYHVRLSAGSLVIAVMPH